MIKSLGMALLVGAMSLGVAAAADLPARTAPRAIFTAVDAPSDSGFYAGVRGGIVTESGKYTAGVGAGYQFNRFVRIEGNYDRLDVRNGGSNLFTGNVIGQYAIGNLTPYVLVGGGLNTTNSPYFVSQNAVYNVGAGVRFLVTEHVELDARYRFVQSIKKDAFSNERPSVNLVTAGVNYLF